MSQAKVDKYKEQKANRKKIMAREKAKHVAALVCVWAVVLGVIGWAGYSGYSSYKSNQPKSTYVIDTTDIDTYISGISSTQAE